MVARLHKVRSSGSYVPPDEEGEEAKEAAAAARHQHECRPRALREARLAAAQQAGEEEADKTKAKTDKGGLLRAGRRIFVGRAELSGDNGAGTTSV